MIYIFCGTLQLFHQDGACKPNASIIMCSIGQTCRIHRTPLWRISQHFSEIIRARAREILYWVRHLRVSLRWNYSKLLKIRDVLLQDLVFPYFSTYSIIARHDDAPGIEAFKLVYGALVEIIWNPTVPIWNAMNGHEPDSNWGFLFFDKSGLNSRLL